jgi:hypothetical protein
MNNNKIDISFILPTNRQHSVYSQTVINNINSLNFNGKTHEIIVVSPTFIEAKNVIFLKEEGSNNGCVKAYNDGFNISKGEYIFLCSDDHIFDYNAPLMVEVLKSNLFKDRKYKIACFPTNKHGPCQLPDYCSIPAIIARYPAFERKTVLEQLQGFIYHPQFKHHYPDNWLGYWLHMQGETPIEINKLDMMSFMNSCVKTHDEYDENVFKNLIENYKTNKNYV